MKPKLILGVVAIVGFTSLLMYNFGNSISTYVNFEEAVDRTSAHVIGTWDNTLDYGFSRETMRCTFHMKDKDGNVRKMDYQRPKPHNIEETTQDVVIEMMRYNT